MDVDKHSYTSTVYVGNLLTDMNNLQKYLYILQKRANNLQSLI